jgi:hypothetical protein
MKKLQEMIANQSTCEEKLENLQRQRTDLMTKILEAENSGSPPGHLQKKLTDLDGHISIAQNRLEHAQHRVFEIAVGLVDDKIKNYDSDLKQYQQLHADFTEKAGECLNRAAFYLLELQEVDFANMIKAKCLDFMGKPATGPKKKILEILTRKVRPDYLKPELSALRENLNKIQAIKKGAISKSALAYKLIRYASE